ncbi:MAG: NAD(P)/FAD-dependent oxidoreductase [Roseovarius sp.]
MAPSCETAMHTHSYWLDGLDPPAVGDAALPDRADVVIIGSGYTGLNAAIEVARGGQSCVVVEAETPGYGCSTRNGGQIGPGIKPSLSKLTQKFGAERARAIRAEGTASMDWIEARIKAEGIECDYSRCGMYYAAHTPHHYDGLCDWTEMLHKTEGFDGHLVPQSQQHQELGSDIYYGGAVLADNGGLHPAKYLHGLLRVALDAGVQVIGACAATSVTRVQDHIDVQTVRGRVRADNVIVATNGYTGRATPWLQRRVIPIASSIITTDVLPKDLVTRLFPTKRIICDTRKVVYYYRPSPDGQRVVFGGRVAARDIGAQETARRLREKMCQIFPELKAYGMTHSWSGTVAYTFDELPHIGSHEGVHYAMGYCGSGVAMSSYLGAKIGQKVLGAKAGQSAFDGLPNHTRPLYTGRPWFLPAAVSWYRWQDERAQTKARRA